MLTLPQKEYHRCRIKIEIAEGVKDFPAGEGIPLESNLVYMNGISFTKDSQHQQKPWSQLAFANESLHLRTTDNTCVQLKASVPDWWASDEN
ncbi:putative transferase CAF17 homolog, mitochondrial [Scyliorhinus torazame]|uniref:putative transferase CAF17 homolog, mitochondrial n=1 Tax=Scyliorhinus torazame TaxID=75743 RepID=UPI003B5A3CF4